MAFFTLDFSNIPVEIAWYPPNMIILELIVSDIFIDFDKLELFPPNTFLRNQHNSFELCYKPNKI